MTDAYQSPIKIKLLEKYDVRNIRITQNVFNDFINREETIYSNCQGLDSGLQNRVYIFSLGQVLHN